MLTNDFAEMLAFSKDVLGLEVLRLSPDYAEFQNDGLRLHLTTRANMKAAVGHESYDERRGGQSFELAFSVKSPEEVDAFYRAVVERGATPVQPPADVPWGQRVAFFADPDGNIHDVVATLALLRDPAPEAGKRYVLLLDTITEGYSEMSPEEAAPLAAAYTRWLEEIEARGSLEESYYLESTTSVEGLDAVSGILVVEAASFEEVEAIVETSPHVRRGGTIAIRELVAGR